MWDRHYHEFEDWQLDWLLEKPDGKLPLGKIYTSQKKLALDPYYAIHTKVLYRLRRKNFIEPFSSEITKTALPKF
jgi:hypothetical protein